MDKPQNKHYQENDKKRKSKLLWEKYDIPYVRICRTIIWILDKQRENQESKKLYGIIDAYVLRKLSEVNHGNLETFVKKHIDNGIYVDRSPFTNKINFIEITEKFENYLRSNFKPAAQV